jgi:hypothetical protein
MFVLAVFRPSTLDSRLAVSPSRLLADSLAKGEHE